MTFIRGHILSIVAFMPLLGALILLLPFFRRRDRATRVAAGVVGVSIFLISLPLWFWFDRAHSASFQFEEQLDWMPALGVRFHLGVDGISVLLVLLTSLLGAIAMLSSWSARMRYVRPYYVCLLVLQTGMLGVFCALDMLLFFMFWEFMLVPMFLLIVLWGGAHRIYAATKYLLFLLFGSVVMLLGILALYFHSSLTGSVLQMINHGLSVGGLILIVGILCDRRHASIIDAFGGLARAMPVGVTAMLVLLLASLGLPLLNGFVGLLLVFLGTFAVNRLWALWLALGAVLGAACWYRFYRRVFRVEIAHDENRLTRDLDKREMATFAPLIALCIWIGVYPLPFLRFLEPPMARLAETIQPERYSRSRRGGSAQDSEVIHVYEEPIVPESR